MYRHRKHQSPLALVLNPFNGERAGTRRAKPRGLFYLGRTDRVSNEPMFGVAIKKTGCAFRPARELATGISGTGQIGDDRLGHDTVALEIECSPYGSSSPN
jgi:hypothetical protein